jgi:hypothetical protein
MKLIETLSIDELSQILHKARGSILNDLRRAPHLVPPQTRKVGSRHLWLKQTVIDWLSGQTPHSPQTPSPRRSGRPRKTDRQV